MPDTQNNAILNEATKTFQVLLDTLKKKNAAYAGDKGTFHNFMFAANMASVSVEQGMLIRLSDKFARMCNLVHNPSVANDEPLTDTINDMIGYLIILKAYTKWLKGSDVTNSTPISPSHNFERMG